MKKILPILFLLCFTLNSRAQQIELFHRVEVKLQGKSIVDLARLGIETDHGVYQHGRSFTTDLSESEIQLVEQAGFETKVLIEDMSTYYRLQLGSVSNAVSDRSGDCGNTGTSVAGSQYTTPSNYTFGSMGGYQTLDELYATLDEMHQKFPDLISARAMVSDTIYTHEGRSQYYVRISDNANVDEDEPEILYTALHHSREPNGMSQLLFFMWHILENYDSDPVLKYLVDNAELYFLPCVNPDGYIRNELTNPNGGGLWRKNLRDNGDGTFGVDLNRNYGYEWGFDDIGSSTNTGSQTYRGPGPFSEPETRMTRDFCNAHEFRIVLNYHTYGNLLIWPWAYSDELADPGLAVLGNLISSENNYSAGTATETVGYQVNGSSDDWMFGGADAYAYTPEVGPGTFGFWPPSDTIDGLNKANVTANLISGLSILNYVQARDADDGSFSLLNPILPVEVQRYGFESGAVTVSLTPVTSNVLGVSPGVVLDLMQFEKTDIQFTVQFADGVASGEEAVFLLQVDNGLVVFEDTLRKTLVGPAITVFDEPGDNMDQWASFAWGISTDTYYSAPSSIGDSPNGDYPNDAAFDIISQTITIPADASNVTLRFWTKFAIEPNYDYVTLEAREMGGASEYLCGQYTTLGTQSQLFNVPLYDGFQTEWVQECIDLSAYAGKTIDLIFTLVSDGFLEYDGFYFDDLEVVYFDPNFVGTKTINQSIFALQATPNPASETSRISWTTTDDVEQEGFLLVYNQLGQKIYQAPVHMRQGNHEIQLAEWPEGTYYYRLETSSRASASGKLQVGAGK